MVDIDLALKTISSAQRAIDLSLDLVMRETPYSQYGSLPEELRTLLPSKIQLLGAALARTNSRIRYFTNCDMTVDVEAHGLKVEIWPLEGDKDVFVLYFEDGPRIRVEVPPTDTMYLTETAKDVLSTILVESKFK